MPGQEFYNNSSLFQQPKQLCSHSRQSHMGIPVGGEGWQKPLSHQHCWVLQLLQQLRLPREGLHGHTHCATKLVDMSHCEHAAVYTQNMGDK